MNNIKSLHKLPDRAEFTLLHSPLSPELVLVVFEMAILLSFVIAISTISDVQGKASNKGIFQFQDDLVMVLIITTMLSFVHKIKMLKDAEVYQVDHFSNFC